MPRPRLYDDVAAMGSMIHTTLQTSPSTGLGESEIGNGENWVDESSHPDTIGPCRLYSREYVPTSSVQSRSVGGSKRVSNPLQSVIAATTTDNPRQLA